MRVRHTGLALLVVTLAATAASASVVNIDLSALFNKDNIVNYYNSVVDTGDGARSSYMVTDAYALYQNATSGNGLPDNGFFSASLSTNTLGIDVQLGYSNSDNGSNSIEIATSGTTTTINLKDSEKGQYTSLYLFAWAKEGDVPVNYVITYADNTTSTGSLTAKDWFYDWTGTPTLINGMDRYYTGSYQNSNDPAIFAYSLAPNSSKTIKAISLTTGTVATNRSAIFMGISGEATLIPEPASLALLSVAGLIAIRRRK